MSLFHFGGHKNKGTDEAKPVAPTGETVSEGGEPVPEQAPLRSALRDLGPYQPPIPTGDGPYADSDEHLWHTLARADMLVRAQTLRWFHTIAIHKSEQYWGMVNVTKAEVSAFLASIFMRGDELPVSLIDAMKPYWDAARQIDEDIGQRRAQTPPDIGLRLVELESLCRLSPLDLAILLVCLLPELDGRYRRLYGFLQDDASRARPNVELALQILQPVLPQGETARAALNRTAPLRARHLIQVTDTQGVNDPLSTRALHVDPRLVDFLLGSNKPDNRLKGILSEPEQPLSWQELILEPEQATRLKTLADWLKPQAQSPETLPTFFLHGAYGSGKLDTARALSLSLRQPLLVIDTRAALRAPEGWAQTVDLALREGLLRGGAVYWAETHTLREPDRPKDEWEYLLAAAEAHRGMVFMASEKPWDPTGRYRNRPFLRIDLPAPGYQLRRSHWEKQLPPAELLDPSLPEQARLADILANGFQLTGGQIADAVAAARAIALQRDPARLRISLDDIYDGCRRQTSRGLTSFARLIEPRTGLSFEDLILPEPNKHQLAELRSRIRFRSAVYTGMGFERRLSLGKGLIALFTGASGTGKTMAAELLGREYGMQIFKIDLAAVVSKYVGETEKNLSKVFDEAEDANAILLFDEGETLFGKRGEIKEARDRWANNEASFLLQRVEEYRGVVIITTNFRQNMDAAFLRRIHVSVDFPRPDAAERLRIWLGMFPEGVQRPSDAELKALAEKFLLTGGNIKNVVIDAAFRSLAEDSPAITVRHLVLGIAREAQKLGRALTKVDFGEDYFGWVEKEILMNGQAVG